MTPSKSRVVIIGGGMAGLTAAWELSAGDWRDQFESITVYQRGWRLGGKGASSRGINGRIEEHGLHVLLGYYHETFRVMDECYRELDRGRTDRDCPIRDWADAVAPASDVGLADQVGAGWSPWSMEFPERPPRSEGAIAWTTALDVALHSLRLLAGFHNANSGQSRNAAVTLSSSPDHPDVAEPAAVTTAWMRGLGLTTLAGAVELIERAQRGLDRRDGSRFASLLGRGLGTLRDSIEGAIGLSASGPATLALVDLAATNLVGVVADRLLTRRDGLRAIDDMDYRDWLRRHGAAPQTIDSALVRAMYDLVFAYRDGEADRPAFAAGLGLELATRMLFTYKGALFWKMQAGMGEVIFAPLYQVLAERGVRFEFFHRVDEITASAGSVDSIVMGRQIDLRDPDLGYQPLRRYGGLPAWPSEADAAQLVGPGDWLGEAESFYGERRDAATVELAVDRDFDTVVFAASLGMVPLVCRSLLEQSPRWQAMVANLGTVATKALQLWLTVDESRLGWLGPRGVTLSGFAEPFDTWASMSHLIDVEQWGSADRVGSIAYFCSVLEEPVDAAEASRHVRSEAVRYLSEEIGAIWPGALDASGAFRWDWLAGDPGVEGQERLDAQYWRANIDPSDRYVQSLPGTDRYRLQPGNTGFDNLVVAGDWTDSGLNAGCIEAATRSGLLAATAVKDKTRQRQRMKA